MDQIGFVPGHSPPQDRCESALWFAFHDGQLLVTDEAGSPHVPRGSDLTGLEFPLVGEIFLGTLRGTQCFAAQLAGGVPLPDNMCLRGLRSLFDELPAEHVTLAGLAAQLIHWHNTQRYCGSCAAPTSDDSETRAKRCSKCGLMFFPRISPAVIVAVVKEGSILLTRSPRFKPGLYSVPAGFVEPGESLEEALRRELAEEVGVEVKNIAYFDSQPWPFPDSLMVAFTAEYAGGEVRPDGIETVDAKWFGAQELPLIPSNVSVARRLIDWFRETHEEV